MTLNDEYGREKAGGNSRSKSLKKFSVLTSGLSNLLSTRRLYQKVRIFASGRAGTACQNKIESGSSLSLSGWTQKSEIPTPTRKGLRVTGKGMSEAVDAGDVSKPGQRKDRAPARESNPLYGLTIQQINCGTPVIWQPGKLISEFNPTKKFCQKTMSAHEFLIATQENS
jgi:hypothetical protein